MLLSKGKKMNNAKSSDFAWDKRLKRKDNKNVFMFLTREVYPFEVDEMWLDENKLSMSKAVDNYIFKAIEKCSKKIKKTQKWM